MEAENEDEVEAEEGPPRQRQRLIDEPELPVQCELPAVPNLPPLATPSASRDDPLHDPMVSTNSLEYSSGEEDASPACGQ